MINKFEFKWALLCFSLFHNIYQGVSLLRKGLCWVTSKWPCYFLLFMALWLSNVTICGLRIYIRDPMYQKIRTHTAYLAVASLLLSSPQNLILMETVSTHKPPKRISNKWLKHKKTKKELHQKVKVLNMDYLPLDISLLSPC